jgi:UDP-glucose 4-epimerase
VAALARSEGKLAAITPPPNYLFLRCDLTDEEQARRAIEGFAPQILYHFASHPDGRESFEQANAAIRGNLLATLNALEAFRRCGGQLFVYGDSCKVYGDCQVPYRASMPLKPTSSYAISKAAGWQLCELYRRQYGLACVSVRPTLIYGPRQNTNLISFVARCVAEGRQEVRMDGGEQTRDPLFIDDALDAFRAVGEAGTKLAGAVINIGGGHERRVVDLAREVLAVLGSSVPVVADDSRLRTTEMQRSYCDNSEAATLLGWEPATPLRAGLERTLLQAEPAPDLVHQAASAGPASRTRGK